MKLDDEFVSDDILDAISRFDISDLSKQDAYKMKPEWWMKYGIFTAFLIFLLVVIMAGIIRYPDVISGEFRLLSSVPSIYIPLPSGMQIDQVFVGNNNVVKKGEHILLFSSNADYSDIIRVEKIIIGNKDCNRLFHEVKAGIFNLGELQDLWSQLYGKLLDHYMVTDLRKYDAEIERSRNFLDKQHQLKESLYQMLVMNDRGVSIWEESMIIDSVLYRRNAMTKQDLLAKEENYINKSKSIKQDEIAAKRNGLEIAELENNIAALIEKKREHLLTLNYQISELSSQLLAGIGAWKLKYLVVAHIDGQVNFIGNIDEKRYIIPEEHSIVITPEYQEFKASIKLPLLGAGKIAVDQIVHFKLNDYPYREFGYLEGTLSSVSNVAGLTYYLGEAHLGQVLRTNNNKDIVIKENMGGVAEVITNDRSVLSRVLDKVLYIFRK